MARRTPAKDKPSSHGWTPKRVAILQKLWLDGLSAGQIAKLLGGTTRNAVNSKISRMQIGGRTEAAPPVTHPIPSREPPPLAIVVAGPVVDHAEFGRAALALGPGLCKFPIGDPRLPGFRFCCARTAGTYCVAHARLCYQPKDTSGKARRGRPPRLV